jgi:hypothetical protein
MGSRLPRRKMDTEEVRARLAASRDAPVKLRVAASLLHNERTGRSRASMRGPDYLAQLNESARALSEVVDVYHVAEGRMTLIPREKLAVGTIQDGGNVLRGADGSLYQRLVVRRGQAIAAITVLAGVKTEA